MTNNNATNINPDFHINVRVYYEDTDAGGVVFYANYLSFFERARTEWLRSVGLNQSTIAKEQKLIFVVKAVEIQYRKPAILDDQLTVHNKLARIGGASFVFNQEVRRGSEVLCDGQVTICCVSTESFKPTPVPSHIRNLFKQAGN